MKNVKFQLFGEIFLFHSLHLFLVVDKKQSLNVIVLIHSHTCSKFLRDS